VELGRSSVLHRRKSATRWHIDRNSKRHNKREE